jgi:hypothetical protein
MWRLRTCAHSQSQSLGLLRGLREPGCGDLVSNISEGILQSRMGADNGDQPIAKRSAASPPDPQAEAAARAYLLSRDNKVRAPSSSVCPCGLVDPCPLALSGQCRHPRVVGQSPITDQIAGEDFESYLRAR